MQTFLDNKFGGDEVRKDNFVFEQTKMILTVTFQHIVYTEYLPIVLGDKYMKEFDLYTKESNFSEYKQSINPTIMNEFATFAYRL